MAEESEVEDCDGSEEEGVGARVSRVEVLAVLVDEGRVVRLFGSGVVGWWGAVRGVGMGVVSVEGVDSTSSASRYHFRRRV